MTSNQTYVQNSSDNLIGFYIKVQRTELYKITYLPATLSVSDFISIIQKNEGRNLLNMDVENSNEYMFLEIVEAGQDIDGVESEDAPKLERSDITLYEKYGERIKYVAFYIRRPTIATEHRL